MKEVIFPLINLRLQLSPIAVSIGGIHIYWYAILIVAAFIIGIILCKKDDGKYGIKFNDIFDLMLFLIPISIICARLYYVVFNLDIYINNPIQIFNIRTGGLAIYGGIIGAIITCIIFCKVRKIHILDMLDYLAPYLALGQAIGRWGNFINVEAYGTVTDLPWRMGIIENGIYKEVHPTFLYESLATFAIFILLMILKNKRQYKGQITYIYLVLYSFARMLIEGLRIDSLMFYNFRISQILSLFIFVIFCIILLYKSVKINKTAQSSTK